MADLDPNLLARRQIEGDVRRTAWLPQLFGRKCARMSVSALAYLRGSAPMYFSLLRAFPSRARGPGGVGWLAGDLHVENFGAYRPNPLPEDPRHHDEPEAVFNLNDFDDAVRGPWLLDVLRLTTSCMLAARSCGADGARATELGWALLSAYPRRGALPPTPKPIANLVDRAAGRTRKELLDDRTEIAHGKRRFVRGERYLPLPSGVARELPQALARYVRGIPAGHRPSMDHFEIIDAALRIAGTGSLGCLRVAVLTKGKGGVDGSWIIDVKEEGSPSAGAFMRVAPQVPAARVLAGLSGCLPFPPRFAGQTRLRGKSMLVRKLTPQEDKIDFPSLEAADWRGVAVYLGALAGAAHRRGATKPPSSPWRDSDLQRILDNAIWLAGVHEAVYLAYCRQIGERRR